MLLEYAKHASSMRRGSAKALTRAWSLVESHLIPFSYRVLLHLNDTQAMTDKNIQPKTQPKRPLHRREASFTDAEKFFLHKLLIDEPEDSNSLVTVLTDDILFSVPSELELLDGLVKPKPPLRGSLHGLWKAHEHGISPALLIRKAFKHDYPDQDLKQRTASHHSDGIPESPRVCEFDEADEDDMSDVEVRPDPETDHVSEASSWSETKQNSQYNTWEMLKDEYASDFGFDFQSTASIENILNDNNSDLNTFLILGTSADDESCHPHVMSPPLMDSLTAFLPERLEGENWWLKYSLVRDGASLNTMRNYVRAAEYTVLAIETVSGEVFGCFTSSRWTKHLGYYGSSPAFVWKMRHSRQTKCFSLYEQAQLESEIDVFMYSGDNDFVQVSRHNAIAVGGDDQVVPDNEWSLQERIDGSSGSFYSSGFAICLEDDLLRGTTSFSTTFRNPPLCGTGDKTVVFEVSGLEVWTFTPCRDVPSAQAYEMNRFFVEESISARSTGRQFTSSDLSEDMFYRRVGHDSESEDRRNRWQYTNSMGGVHDRVTKGFGATPRFG